MATMEFDARQRVEIDCTPRGWSSARRTREAIARALGAAMAVAPLHRIEGDGEELLLVASVPLGASGEGIATLQVLAQAVRRAVQQAFDGDAAPVAELPADGTQAS